jgi:hypothetical protein
MKSPKKKPIRAVGMQPRISSSRKRLWTASRGNFSKSRKSRQKTQKTASSVPKWSSTSRVTPALSNPKRRWQMTRCPELLTGKNSVNPCTTPSIMVLIKLIAFSSSIPKVHAWIFSVSPLFFLQWTNYRSVPAIGGLLPRNYIFPPAGTAGPPGAATQSLRGDCRENGRWPAGGAALPHFSQQLKAGRGKMPPPAPG